MSKLAPTAAPLLALVVDDDPAGRLLVRASLEKGGLQVIEADSGERALEKFVEMRPDLVLLDVIMPGIDGFEACRMMRTVDAGATIPILMLTAMEDILSIEKSYEAGATDFIAKPVNYTLLEHRIRYVLRVAAESRQLKTSERRLATAQRIARLAHWEWDLKVAAVSIPEDLSQILGRTPGTMLDLVSLPWVHADDRARVAEVLAAAKNLHQSFSLEHRVIASDGTQRIVHQEAEIANESLYQGVRLVGTVQEITRRKEIYAQLLHADRLVAVGQLAAGIAHEINNPATFVLGNLSVADGYLTTIDEALAALRAEIETSPVDPQRLREILSAPELAESRRELSDIVRENIEGVQRIARLVQDLGAFSRIDHDAGERVDIASTVEVAANIVGNELRRHARLVREFQPLPEICGDSSKLTQVFTNILINAAHAVATAPARDGSGHEIRISGARKGFDRVSILIEDTGGGVPEQIRDQIFQPFFTTKARGEGTGLGLALSADIVRQHGGELSLASTGPAGTCFMVELPVRSHICENSASPSYAFAAENETYERRKILVVDDDVAVLKALQRMIGSVHEVVSAHGGREAMALIKSTKDFDLVLSDLMMPRFDGTALFNFLVAEQSFLSNNILFMTGGATTDTMREFVSSRQDRILRKPLRRTHLLRTICRVTPSPL